MDTLHRMLQVVEKVWATPLSALEAKGKEIPSGVLCRLLPNPDVNDPPQILPELARYQTLAQLSASILDTYIPRCRRLTQLHFGQIVSNPDAPQAFNENVGYNMTYNLVEPFKGNALHIHPAVEIFIALDGEWEIAWGAEGKQSTLLQPFDLVAVPANVRHSYKNVKPHTAHNIMTILPGKASITWAPAVVAEARAHGAQCTDDGVLIDFWSKSKLAATGGDEEDLSPRGSETDESASYHRPMTDEAMARNVRRYASGQPLVVQTPEGHLCIRWHTLRRGDAFDACGLPADVDLLVVVLEGDTEVKADGKLLGYATRLDAIRIPAHTSPRRVVLANLLPGACTLLVVESKMRGLMGKHCDQWEISDAVLPQSELKFDVPEGMVR
jgi:quercetin dioxygenase-like cupin family protein